jgi:hypothetical protein
MVLTRHQRQSAVYGVATVCQYAIRHGRRPSVVEGSALLHLTPRTASAAVRISISAVPEVPLTPAPASCARRRAAFPGSGSAATRSARRPMPSSRQMNAPSAPRQPPARTPSGVVRRRRLGLRLGSIKAVRGRVRGTSAFFIASPSHSHQFPARRHASLSIPSTGREVITTQRSLRPPPPAGVRARGSRAFLDDLHGARPGERREGAANGPR